ncbi:O-methyltransferase [Staphylococcus saccharolyticus]|uniref:tRNA 5-hydroxyuridine methyltransferase n=1 Tax=Staphylococcus saccharolyticus TaxID=33028 RepID=A0A380H6G8_9STAP|nr:O-methyltransferase [Staphylococcus saccharolyticus]MBL7565126.1 O-methyltransferase [Staphylococcus saccharolyticus]MBL7571837.1 O-methyltransferase [Staphylococcus saccharolyticus]QQB98323.1 O-methyltransferase [Staphylococcus saccharolyticus]QRJ65823.1 O-methyltransferase [Staphylococcus saccharolyticus]RTX97912.1 O-methyltransferase [Staphylococcus saccharolyticus]
MNLNQNYLTQLHQSLDNEIENLRDDAESNQVPIVDKLTLDLLKQLIRMNNAKEILEIGTAIGYSSMQFASISDGIKVTTIERNENMIMNAKVHFQEFNYQHQIRLIEADALEAYDQVNDREYDMIFIDAAKAQSRKFFELYTPLLKKGGLVVTDNVLYHGFVSNIDIVRSRNVKQMVKKVQQYNQWLMKQSHFTTNFINMDDGIAISIKGE